MRFSFAFLALSTTALASTGVYIGAFDPIQQAQVDAALMAAQKHNLDRVVFFLDPEAPALESFETRWELLSKAIRGQSRLVLPSQEDLIQWSTSRESSTRWSPWAVEPRDLVPLRERNSPWAARHKIPDEFRGRSIDLLGPRQKAKKGQRFVRLRLDPNQVERVHENASLNESLLPRSVAIQIRQERLYRHDGRRGYYSLPSWLTDQVDMEQRWNDRVENRVHFESIGGNNLPRQYWPDDRPVFALYHVDLTPDQIRTVTTSDGEGIGHRVVALKNGKLRFFAHPQSTDLYRIGKDSLKWVQKYWATPTSSFRSLVVWDPDSQEAPFGLKLSLDAKIGGPQRILSASQIERATAARAAFQSFDRAALEKEGIHLIDEPIGLIYAELDHGFSIRELARPSQGARLVPMFSLYAKRPGQAPLLEEMIGASGQSAGEFVDREIMEPLVRHMHFIYWKVGLVGEPHEQNVLIEVKNLKPTGRFFYRDFAGFHWDLARRTQLNFGIERLPRGVRVESLKLGRAHLVENALDYLLRSNFFAMQQALRSRYPELTQTFVEDRFRDHMRLQFSELGGVTTGRTIPEWRRAISTILGESQGRDCVGAIQTVLRRAL